MKPFKKIVIVGLGLMGGSLAAAVRKKFPKTKIAGVARREKTLLAALRSKWIDDGYLEISKALPGADLVIICTPVDSTLLYLNRIEKSAEKEILVTDIGSVKNAICEFARKKKWQKVRFIGAHPMVGSHEQGIEHADACLYQGGLTIITAKKNQPGFSAVNGFWKSLGMKTWVMDSRTHDSQVAEISHLPHLLSSCLMQTPSEGALKVAASGFRDMTRLAEAYPQVWLPIFLQNKKAVLQAIRSFKINLNQFESLLRSDNPEKLYKVLSSSSARKAALRSQE